MDLPCKSQRLATQRHFGTLRRVIQRMFGRLVHGRRKVQPLEQAVNSPFQLIEAHQRRLRIQPAGLAAWAAQRDRQPSRFIGQLGSLDLQEHRPDLEECQPIAHPIVALDHLQNAGQQARA